MASIQDLTHAVECKWSSHFETIAAFNCEDAAEAYASSCRVVNRRTPLEYRVTELWQDEDACKHSWVCSRTGYGGDDPSYGRVYCEYCGADGDA